MLAALLLLALLILSRPQRATALLLDRVGAALGLEITATGHNAYRLRGTPMLELRDLVAREPGAQTPLLRADRVYVAVPWSTLRARGALLDATRLELDGPVLDLPALQHWLATRPPSEETRLPSLREGLRVRDGVVQGAGWRVEGIALETRSFRPDAPLRAQLRARYLAPPLSVPMDVALALGRLDALLDGKASGLGIAGRVSVEHGQNWRLPARVLLSGPLRFEPALAVAPLRAGIAATYEAGDTRVPFALGALGPLHFDDAGVALAPTTLVLHGRGAAADTSLVPRLQARGRIAWTQRLDLQLRGRLAGWPQAWPALPAPLDASIAPLPFALDYAGAPDFADLARLRLARDATRFDGRFRLPAVLDWIDRFATGNPLPPLDGTLTTPRLDIAGARLQGVEISVDDDAIAPTDGR
ncbi:MAG TPA: hypothetical protein VFG18_03205 [Xanthomonadaceae bacterium]|nr:hypothetical protein [Xanthomonadaceae bacterium]